MRELITLDPNAIEQAPMLRVSAIKVGDALCRRNDHLGRQDDDLTVVEKHRGGRTSFRVCSRFCNYDTLSGGSLSAQNYTLIVREGKVIGKFLVKYW